MEELKKNTENVRLKKFRNFSTILNVSGMWEEELLFFNYVLITRTNINRLILEHLIIEVCP